MKFYSSVDTPAHPHANHLYTLNTESFSIDVDPIDKKRYRASAEVAALGPLTIGRVESNAAIVTRKSEKCADQDSRRFSFIFVCDGEVIISHNLGSTELARQEFLLLDNQHQRTMFVYNRVSLLLVTLPVSVLKKYLPCAEDVCGQKISAQGTDSAFLFDTLLSMWNQIKQGLLEQFAPTLSDNLLKRIGQSYSSTIGNRGSRFTRRITQVKELIEVNLGNPDLRVEMLADQMNVSSRYLRSLFARTEKISHYILRRRLEECANELANSLYKNVSITSIAFQWGFNSPAHFSRAFKQQYGTTPREYRKRHLEQQALATLEEAS